MDQSQAELVERFRLEEAQRLGRHVGQTTYSAIDPASRYVRCGCGKADCWTAGLLPLGDHVAALYQAIISLECSERFPGFDRGMEAWPGVTYALQMAGGIRDLVCDPSRVSDDFGAFYCESAADREDEDRELASKYAAALVTFNFVWNAYEAAIEISLSAENSKEKLPVLARRTFQAEADQALQIRCLRECYGFARQRMVYRDVLKNSIAETIIKYELQGAAAAAELVRVFRNYIVHGDDPLPPDSVGPCYRVYAVTRVVLLLIQHLVWRKVRRPSQPVKLSANREEIGREPATMYLRNLHYADELWRTMTPKTARYGMRTTRGFG